MAQKQPDYKKSANDPYDLNNKVQKVDRRVASTSNPSPYDLDEGARTLQNDVAETNRKR